MQVFKFGGASVKNASAVKNVLNVLRETGPGQKVVVISAMGKTTNALENIIQNYCSENDLQSSIADVMTFHLEITEELFQASAKAKIQKKIDLLFKDLNAFLSRNKSPNYDFIYDQVVGYGELLSTTIVSAYLTDQNLDNTLLDARKLIKTDATYRDAQVIWEQTEKQIKNHIDPDKLSITQGFIASDENNFSTSLGREGSDYSAGILAYCLDASNLTIWKDVEGVLNADPSIFQNTVLLNTISYEEAIELAFYGASVIHPKTLQPVKRKGIPLFVKAFKNPKAAGTKVCSGKDIDPETPCFIVKPNLTLISLSSRDFSFFVEENMSEVFALFHHYQIKVDLIQNSAISFSVCVNDLFNNIEDLLKELQEKFKVKYQRNVSLYTIRYFNQNAVNQIESGKEVLLKQTTRKTVQLVTAHV
jgi:aspartate kinase